MKRRIVNILGAIGYLFLLMQWMWLVVTVLVPIAMQPGVRDLFLPNTEPRPERVIEAQQPLSEPAQWLIFGGAMLFALGATLYAVINVPRAVGKSGQRITQTVAKRAIPVITQHKKITKRRERNLIEKITWGVKAAAIAIPTFLLIIPPGEVLELDHAVAAIFGGLLAGCSIAIFGLQFLLAKVWRIDSRLIW